MAPNEAFNRWRPHPWHGLETGPEPPDRVTAYIEITPFDVVKYEVEKATGYIRVDRPQRGASSAPALYGLIPKTYCGPRVAAIADCAVADGDPLDVCVAHALAVIEAASDDYEDAFVPNTALPDEETDRS